MTSESEGRSGEPGQDPSRDGGKDGGQGDQPKASRGILKNAVR